MRRNTLRTLLLVSLLVVAFVAGQLSAAQPQMQAALSNLRAAKRNLDKATSDKGGHRARAQALVNDAINEVFCRGMWGGGGGRAPPPPMTPRLRSR
jgi:hypothetical protein